MRLHALLAFIVSLPLLGAPPATAPAATQASIALGLPTGKTSFANVDAVVAAEMGFFKKRGLNVEITNFGSGLKVVQAVVAGDLQIGASSFEPVANAAIEGGNIVMIGGYADRLTTSMVVPASTRTVADLRGKNLGIQDVGAFREIMTRMVLENAHMTPDDVHYVTVTDTGYIPALLAGQIQSAILQSEQSDAILGQDKGFHVLADLYKIEPKYVYGTYFASKGWLSKNAATAAKFLAAITEAHRYMYAHRAETVKIASAATGFGPAVIERAYDTIVRGNGVFPVNEGLEPSRVAYTLQRMKSLGLITDKTIAPGDLVDRGPIAQAVTSLGGPLKGDPRWH
jgi:NitT/TauT family transport system substrate-binding protein